MPVKDLDRGWRKFLQPFVDAKPAIYSVWVGTDLDTLKETAPPMKGDFFYPYVVEHGLGRGANGEPRPFLRATLDAHDQYRDELGRIGKYLLKENDGKDPTLSAVMNLRLLGKQVVRDIQTSIQGYGAIDTSRMYRSIKVLRVGEDASSDKVGVVPALVQGAE